MRIVFLTSQRFREVKTQLIFKLVRIGHPFNNFAVIGFFGQKIYKSLQCRKLSRLVHVGNGQTSSKMNDFKTFNVFVIFCHSSKTVCKKKNHTYILRRSSSNSNIFKSTRKKKKKQKKCQVWLLFVVCLYLFRIVRFFFSVNFPRPFLRLCIV